MEARSSLAFKHCAFKTKVERCCLHSDFEKQFAIKINFLENFKFELLDGLFFDRGDIAYMFMKQKYENKAVLDSSVSMFVKVELYPVVC